MATELGVGIEIDYEENTDPNIDGLQQFIEAYRSVHPYDASGTNPAARLTIDLAAGDRTVKISKKRSRILCHSSASSYSASSIEPFTSAKSIVTCLRSPSWADFGCRHPRFLDT